MNGSDQSLLKDLIPEEGSVSIGIDIKVNQFYSVYVTVSTSHCIDEIVGRHSWNHCSATTPKPIFENDDGPF